MLYDIASGASRELMSGYVGQQQWSLDGTRIAFSNLTDKKRVWVLDPAQPAAAAPLSDRELNVLASWTPDGKAVVAYDGDSAYWIGLDGNTLDLLSSDRLYGKELEWMTSNRIRVHPSNPGLLLVSAYFQESPRGARQDEMGLTPTVMLFDCRTGRRTPVLANTNWGMDAHWSPDGDWIYFVRHQGRPGTIYRIHADGSGLERVAAGSQVDVAR